MRLLVLGGTKFLGRHLVEAGLERGYTITILHRGQTNPALFPNVEKIHANRDGELDVLHDREWDAVIDTSGYVPRVVKQAVEKLKHAVGHYTFVSSISVYRDFSTIGLDEHAPILELEDVFSEDVEQSYGALKALCESEVQAEFEDRALVVRPGLIVGPHDPTDRFTYWPRRFAQGGDVLVPSDPFAPVQFIDVRDLAEWMLTMIERKVSGVFNATGPSTPLTMREFMATCVDVTPKEANPVWVSEEFLARHQVGEWVELPLWISKQTNWPGFMAASQQRAMAAGLTFRPLAQTLSDTMAWSQGLAKDRLWQAGLSPERERELLAAWYEEAQRT